MLPQEPPEGLFQFFAPEEASLPANTCSDGNLLLGSGLFEQPDEFLPFARQSAKLRPKLFPPLLQQFAAVFAVESPEELLDGRLLVLGIDHDQVAGFGILRDHRLHCRLERRLFRLQVLDRVLDVIRHRRADRRGEIRLPGEVVPILHVAKEEVAAQVALIALGDRLANMDLLCNFPRLNVAGFL